MAGKRTLKKRANLRKKGGCSSCGKNITLGGGCSCNKKNFFGGKKSRKKRRSLNGGNCGCGGTNLLKFKGGNGGFAIEPTSQSFTNNIVPAFNDTFNDPTTPAFIQSGRLMGDYSSPTFTNAGRYLGGRKKGKKHTKKTRGGDLLLGASAPANMVLNSGTSIGTGALVNGLTTKVNIDGAPYSQPNLKTTVV
jgi:hypothetical protein